MRRAGAILGQGQGPLCAFVCIPAHFVGVQLVRQGGRWSGVGEGDTESSPPPAGQEDAAGASEPAEPPAQLHLITTAMNPASLESGRVAMAPPSRTRRTSSGRRQRSRRDRTHGRSDATTLWCRTCRRCIHLTDQVAWRSLCPSSWLHLRFCADTHHRRHHRGDEGMASWRRPRSSAIYITGFREVAGGRSSGERPPALGHRSRHATRRAARFSGVHHVALTHAVPRSAISPAMHRHSPLGTQRTFAHATSSSTRARGPAPK